MSGAGIFGEIMYICIYYKRHRLHSVLFLSVKFKEDRNCIGICKSVATSLHICIFVCMYVHKDLFILDYVINKHSLLRPKSDTWEFIVDFADYLKQEQPTRNPICTLLNIRLKRNDIILKVHISIFMLSLPFPHPLAHFRFNSIPIIVASKLELPRMHYISSIFHFGLVRNSEWFLPQLH